MENIYTNFIFKQEDLKDWCISYDEYTDSLQMFVPNIFSIKKEFIINYQSGDYAVGVIKNEKNPVMLEINNVYNIDKSIRINDISKSNIINFVVDNINKNFNINYGRQNQK